MNRRIMSVLALVLVILVVTLAGCGPKEKPAPEAGGGASEPVSLSFAGGPTGGAWYGLAGSIGESVKAEYQDITVSVMPGGGVGNVMLLEQGKADLGMTVSHLYRMASEGREPYEGEKATHLRALAHVGTSDMGLFLIRDEAKVDSIKDIKEKKYPLKLVTTSKASTPELAAKRLLAQYDITYKDIEAWGGSVTFTNYADAAELISDGHAEAIIAPVVPAVNELTKKVKMKWLAPDQAVVDKMVDEYGYAKVPMLKDKYEWVINGGWTIGEPNIVLVRDDVPEDVVYKIAKLICEKPDIVTNWGSHHANFKPEIAGEYVGGPLHPGAEKYYREVGIVK